jgi:transposase
VCYTIVMKMATAYNVNVNLFNDSDVVAELIEIASTGRLDAPSKATTLSERVAELLAKNGTLTERVHCLEKKNKKLDRQVETQNAEIASLKEQLAFFTRQMFGKKSESYPTFPLVGEQLPLALEGEDKKEGELDPLTEDEVKVVKEHMRKSMKKKDWRPGAPKFADNIPVSILKVPNPEVADLTPDQYEVIGKQSVSRLASRQEAVHVLVLEMETVKIYAEGENKTDRIVQTPLPEGLTDRANYDISLAAKVVIDKVVKHLPLERQAQAMQRFGVDVDRKYLQGIYTTTAGILAGVARANHTSVLTSDTIIIDETPIKAGRGKDRMGNGKMKKGYIWTLVGDKKEVSYNFDSSRSTEALKKLIPSDYSGVLVADGYAVYQTFCDGDKKTRPNITLAQDYVHVRRKFFKGAADKCRLCGQALEKFKRMFELEAEIREGNLSDDAIMHKRLVELKPLIDGFFDWLSKTCKERTLSPTSHFMKAVRYAEKRKADMLVVLTKPRVPLDSNEVERLQRPVAVGRKNWMFCWTEDGARDYTILQSLVMTCLLNDINPYDYLVDVLQRVGTVKQSEIALLTPRLWKTGFGLNPLKSCGDMAVDTGKTVKDFPKLFPR